MNNKLFKKKKLSDYKSKSVGFDLNYIWIATTHA